MRIRSEAPRIHASRFIVGALVLVAGYMAIGAVGNLTSELAVLLVITGAFGAGTAVLSLIGPWVIRMGASSSSGEPRAPALLAARSILDDPRAVWRQVGGIVMTIFIIAMAAPTFALMRMSADAQLSNATFTRNVGTGLYVTLFIAFVMVACSVGVNQAAGVLDRTWP